MPPLPLPAPSTEDRLTPSERTLNAVWVRTAVELGGAAFLATAVYGLAGLAHASALLAPLTLLVLLAALTRRFGFALPGRGFSSFVLGVVLLALLLRGWEFGVLVAVIGMATGDIALRQLRVREALANAGHLAFGTGLVGLMYQTGGGELGRAALAEANLWTLMLAVVLLPIVVNGTFYLEIALEGGVAWVDTRLTLRWEGAVYAASAALATAALALATSHVSPTTTALLAAVLIAATFWVYKIIGAGVHADELRLVQGLAGAIAGDVNIQRSFARIQELTRHLVPWEHMGFARYDGVRDEMELLADTGTTEHLRFSAVEGLTGDVVRSGRPLVSHGGGRATLHIGNERTGSEVLVPLYQGTQLVGVWSVRHGTAGTYREADAALLNLVAPQLALSLALSALLTPVSDTTRQTAAYVEQLTATSRRVSAVSDDVARSAARAEQQAQTAAARVSAAVSALEQVVEGVHASRRAADRALDATRTVSSTAQDVQQASRGAVQQLSQLGTAIEQGAAEVGHLRDAAQEVERFSETIAGIANQTNLLALNATIEASRAGVHGRGFGVVADEVRKLAEESAHAARTMSRSAQSTRRVLDRAARILEEIGQRLADLAASSNRWTQELSEVMRQADEARLAGEQFVEAPRANLALADEAGRILTEAQAAATSSAREASAVTNAAAEQVRAMDEIARGARELSGLAARLAQGARFMRGEDGHG